MPVNIDFLMPIEYAVKVHANSTELTEDELRKIVNEKVLEDLTRDAKYLNACAGCQTEDRRTFSYSYEAVASIK